MQSSTRNLAIGAAAVVLAVVLFVVLQGGDDNDDGGAATTTTTSAQPAEPDAGGGNGATGGNGGGGGQEPPAAEVAKIVVRNGQPVGGVQELEFAKGDTIRFVVASDVAEEVHLHGYDVAKDVEAGGRVSFDVSATIEGVFEVELEHSVVPLAEIAVTPG
ncbi:MAG TPA: hypothetical protein VHJ54_10325 [Solirubrobacterales bacterium]|jgi:hypothetical protein|nr:hypothetical protein [Solirubrobacterales bacterium]